MEEATLRIVVAGAGYVGLSVACLLAQRNEVKILDIVESKIDDVNNRVSPIADADIESLLASGKLDLVATRDAALAYVGADFVIIATPTNYDDESNFFDTSAVEEVVEQAVSINPSAVIVIKSTIPVGFTQQVSDRHPGTVMMFSPEFLREGRALHDNLFPSRIIVGVSRQDSAHMKAAERFSSLLVEGAACKNDHAADIPRIVVGAAEAEAVKLFANTYLALRVSFFNELDTYAESKGLNARQIIEGVCLDPRIGDHYNNPSFGYGGYCLPKDSKQLLANYDDVPQNLIRAIVESNETRKRFIADQVIKRNPKCVGVYRLVMKEGSDNFRESSVQGVMKHLGEHGVPLLVYEPLLEDDDCLGAEVVRDLTMFKRRCDLIITNRFNDELADVLDKVVTRDQWRRD